MRRNHVGRKVFLESSLDRRAQLILECCVWERLPGDFIMQWGSVTAGPAGTRVAFQFAFPKQCLRVFLTVSNGNYPGYVSSDSPTITGFNAYAAADASANFLAIGN